MRNKATAQQIAPFMSLDQTLSQYCVIARDELLFKEKCATQARSFNQDLHDCQARLAEFAQSQPQPCIPVTVRTADGEPQQMFLKTSEKTTYKAVDEEGFKRVVEKVPTVEDLKAVFDDMESPQASLADVYATWLFRQLYNRNTEKKRVFEISDKKGRTKKNAPAGHIHVPDHIVALTEQWTHIQSNMKRLKEFKRSTIHRFENEKKAIEPVLNSYLAAKPHQKQEQKIAMSVQGEIKPFYLKRVVKRLKPRLTLPQSRSLILDTVTSVIKTRDPFDLDVTREILKRHATLPNLIFSEFRTQLEQYRQSRVKVSTHIKLCEPRTRKRKEPTETAEEDSDHDSQP